MTEETLPYKRKEATEKLTNLAIKYLTDSDPDVAIAVEVGLPKLSAGRVDIFAIDRAGTIRIIEVKSCRDDFTSDKKWRSYLEYCDLFYFITPPQVVCPTELPEGVGLLQPYRLHKISSTDYERLTPEQWKPKNWVNAQICKRPKRLYKIELHTRFYMLRKLAFHNYKRTFRYCPRCGFDRMYEVASPE